MKESLFGKTLNELIPVVKKGGLPSFTARQLAEWLYIHKTDSISSMTNLSKKAREWLLKEYIIDRSEPVSVTESTDGTKKYLFSAAGNKFIESAYIPEAKRNTLCISSQVGCKMGCRFCMTGRQGFQADLTAGEILNQVISIPESDKISNIVYMGMGEPFDNTGNVLRSIEILTSDWGLKMSPRRVTVSTIGIIPGMKEFISGTEAHLAVSMHTPFPDERSSLMPVENKYPIHEVIKEIKSFDWGGQRRVSFEYIMFRGFNDTERHIRELVKLLGGLRCRINLIRYHKIPGFEYESSSKETILKFRDRLSEKGIITTIRASRGEDIMAACGLLSTQKYSEGS